MTTTTIQGAPAYEEEESFCLPQMCDGKQWISETCDNAAEYRCRVSCCGGIIWWCEECLFAFFEFCDYLNSDGWEHLGTCIFCFEKSVIDKDHVKVIGRIT